MPTITITGHLGARARELGMAVAAILGIDYIDQLILVDAAHALGVPVNVVAQHDERTATLGERLSAALNRFLERSAMTGAGDPVLGSSGLDVLLDRSYTEIAAEAAASPAVDENRYREALAGIMNELGRKGNILIVGRGSQVILRELKPALHCLCIASEPDRLNWIMERERLEKDAALSRMKEHEKHWAAFHRRLFKADVYDPQLYDLVVNTSRVSFDAAAKLIADLAVEKGRLEQNA